MPIVVCACCLGEGEFGVDFWYLVYEMTVARSATSGSDPA